MILWNFIVLLSGWTIYSQIIFQYYVKINNVNLKLLQVDEEEPKAAKSPEKAKPKTKKKVRF